MPPGWRARRTARIIFKHILPNTVGVIIVNTTLLMAAAILLEAALELPRLRHPFAGRLAGLADQRRTRRRSPTRPWLFWWPGVFIVVDRAVRQLHRRRSA